VSDTVAAHLADQTFIAAGRPAVAAVMADPDRWSAWWPDLTLSVSRDRGAKGHQWVLTGEIGGTAEIYLEPWHDGTLVHLFLRLQLPAGRGRRLERDLRERALAWKASVTAVKDELEGDRVPGTAARARAQVLPES
jgi:hypothetical protein